MVVEAGKISIKDLQFNCIIGTLPYEREKEQPIVLNVALWLDFYFQLILPIREAVRVLSLYGSW